MLQEQLANSQDTESKSDYSRNFQEQSSSKKQFILQNQLFQNSNFDNFEKKDYYQVQNESYKNYDKNQNIQNETINYEQVHELDQIGGNSNNYINIYDDARQRIQNQNSQIENEEYFQNQCDQSTFSEQQKQSIHKKDSKKRIVLRETMQGKAPDNLVEKFTSKNLLVSKQSRSAIQLLNDQNLSDKFDVLQIGKNEEKQLNQNNIGSLEFQNQKILTKSQQSLRNQEIDEENIQKCKIFGWGKNFMEQFNYDQNQSLIPMEIMNIGNLQIKQTACGSSHALFLTNQNKIYALGDNEYSQLGLSDDTKVKKLTQVEINIPQFFIKQKTVFEISQICTSNCSYHSIILLTSRFNQILLGSGLNLYGQLGLRFNQENPQIIQGFYDVQNINYEIEDNMIIVKIGCGQYFSSLILAIVGEQQGKREELWTWGKIGQNQNSEFGEIYKIKIQGCSKDMLCGQNSILLSMNNGDLFVINEFFEQIKIKNLPKVVEISSSANKYAAMDINNYIYVWNQDEINGAVTKIQSQIYLKNLTFQRLTIGEDFGHTVDEYGNLYGWGLNNNGELGTGDAIPRPQICQIKLFDGQDNYMRCNNIVTGQQYVIGIFQPVKNQLEQSSSRIYLGQNNKQNTEYYDIQKNDKKKERKSLSQFNERINKHQEFKEQPKKLSHSANTYDRIQIPIQKNQVYQKNKKHNQDSKIVDSYQQYEQNLEQKYEKIAIINQQQEKVIEEAAFNYKTGIFDETYQNLIQLNDQNIQDGNFEKINAQRLVSERRIKKLSELEREAQIRKTAEAISQYRQVYNSFNKNLQIINSIDSQLKEQEQTQNIPYSIQLIPKNRYEDINFEPTIESFKATNSQGQYKTKTIQSTIDADTSNSQLQQLKYSPDILVTKLQPNQTIIDDKQAVSPPIVQSNVHTLRAPPRENFKNQINQEYLQNQTFQNRPRIPPRQQSNRIRKNVDEVVSTEQSELQLEKFKRTNVHFQRQRELSWNDDKSNQLSIKRVQGDLSWRNQNMNIIKSPITTNQNPISMISDSKPHSSFNVTKVFTQNNLIQDRIDEISNKNTNPFKNKSNLQYSQISESFNEIQKSQKFGQNEMYINETFRTSSQNNENSNHYHYENYYKGLEFQDREAPIQKKQFKIMTKQEWEQMPRENRNLQTNLNVPDERRGKSHDYERNLSSQQNQNINQLNQKEYLNKNYRILQTQGNNQNQLDKYDVDYHQRDFIHINQQKNNYMRNGQYEFNLQSENFSGEQSQFNDTRHNLNFNDKIMVGMQFQNGSNKNTTPRSYNQNGYMDTFNQDEQFDKMNNKIPFFMNQNDKINKIEQSKQQSVQRSLLSTASLGKKALVNTNLRQSITSLCPSKHNIENNEILQFNDYLNPPTVSSIDQQYNPHQNLEKIRSVDSRNQKSSIDDIMAKQYSNNQMQYGYAYCETPQEFNQKYPLQENKENIQNINIVQEQNLKKELTSKIIDSSKKQKQLNNQKEAKQIKKQIKMKQKMEKRENYSEREQQTQIEKQDVKMRQTENKIFQKVNSISTTRESKRDSLTVVSTISHSKTDLQDVIVNVGIKNNYGNHNNSTDSNNLKPPKGISNYNLDNIDLSSIVLNNFNGQNYNQNQLSLQKDNKNIQNLLKTIHNQEVMSQDHMEESIQFKQQQNQIFEDIQEKMQNTKKKLNKYKKKLKKYIQINQENERDIQFYKNQNEQLKKQNEVLLQCDEKKEGATMIFLQEQLLNFQDQILQVRKEYQSQIDQLMEENQQLQEVLQQKEDNQKILQEKFQFVESQLQHLDSSLIDQTEANQQLKQQIIQFKSKEKLQNQNNDEIMKDYQRMNQENQSMMIEYGKMKEEISHLQKINQSFENALKDQSKLIHKQNQGIFEAVCQQVNDNQSIKKLEEPIVFMLNQDSRDSLNMPSSASFSQGRALDRNFNAIPYKSLIDYEMQKKENIQSCQLQNVQSQGNHNSAALSFQPSLSQLNEDLKDQQNHFTLLQNQKQYQQMNNINNSLDLSELNKSYNSKKLNDNQDFRNTNLTRQNDNFANENNCDTQEKINKTQTAISSSLQTINTQETQNNYLYQICPNEVDYQGYDLSQHQKLQKSDLYSQNQNNENQTFQLPSRTLQLDEKYTKIIQQNQNESYLSLKNSMQFSQIQNLDQSNIFYEKNTDCSLEQKQYQNNQRTISQNMANHNQEQPKQNYKDFGSQFPNFEYVQKKYLQCPESQNYDSNKNQQLNQLPCQVQKTLSPQNSYVNPIHENMKKDEHIRVQTSVGKDNQMNIGSTSQSTFNKIFTNNIHQISLSSKVSEFETQYNHNQVRIKDQSLSYQEKFRELSFEQQEKLINFIQGNQLVNNFEEIHSKSMIESKPKQQKVMEQYVENSQNDQKPVRLEYSSNFNRYLNHNPNERKKQEIVSNEVDEELISRQSLNNTSRHYKSKSEKGTSSGLCSNTHKLRSLNANSVSYSAKNCPNSVKQSKIIDYKDSILSKFEKKTNEKINFDIKKRDQRKPIVFPIQRK